MYTHATKKEMNKKRSLSEALQQASGKKIISASLNLESDKKEHTDVGVRLGKKVIAGHFDPAVSKQLKQIALDQDTTVQNLLAEALNDLFEKYTKRQIA